MNIANSAFAASYAPVPKSAVPGIVWPAIPSVRDAEALALFAQFEMSQWWSPEALLWHQLHQATALVNYAANNVPFYGERLAVLADRDVPISYEEWQSIPILTRNEIQSAERRIHTQQSLKAHGDSYLRHTSGSTGEPVKVQQNVATSRIYAALTLRDHHWHKRRLAGKIASIRHFSAGATDVLESGQAGSWAPGYASGPTAHFEVTEAVDTALKWVIAEKPHYLSTYPTYLRALLQESARAGVLPSNIDQVLTFGEVVPDDLRTACRDVWGAKLVDIYSAVEIGVMALQCPDHGHYHVQAEGVLIEILDEADSPCAPGEVGRIVVTPLHNFGTPLIRYAIGDYAEVGEPCGCGRGLPVIRRIFGRSRNMLTTSSGEKVWVAVIDCGLHHVEAVRQFQIVQRKDRSVILKLVTDRPLIAAEETIARSALRNATGHEFDVTLDYVSAIPRAPGGKMEDVVSEIIE